MGTYIIATLLFLALAYALYRSFSKRGTCCGNCDGCGGGCSSHDRGHDCCGNKKDADTPED